jgi:hypothetical protein
VFISSVVSQTSRRSNKKNPTGDFRHYPLSMAIKAVDEQAWVIVFDDREVEGALDADVCFCGGTDGDDYVQCKKCKTCYHDWCVNFVDENQAKRNRYECGFCCDDPDDDGIRLWEGPINPVFQDDVNDQLLFRNDNELMYQGKGKLKKRIKAEVQASWSDVVSRVNRAAVEVHRVKMEQFEKAKARIKEGGHHIIDRAGGGGVSDAPVTDEVIDFLEGLGEI